MTATEYEVRPAFAQHLSDEEPDETELELEDKDDEDDKDDSDDESE